MLKGSRVSSGFSGNDLKVSVAIPLSRRRWLWVVSDRLVQIAQLEGLVAALWDFSNQACRLSCNNAEARYHHIWGHDGAVEDANVILDDGKLADGDLGADVDVAPDGGSLHDRQGADEDVVADAEGHVGKCSARFVLLGMHSPAAGRRTQDRRHRAQDSKKLTPCTAAPGDADSSRDSESSSGRWRRRCC